MLNLIDPAFLAGFALTCPEGYVAPGVIHRLPFTAVLEHEVLQAIVQMRVSRAVCG